MTQQEFTWKWQPKGRLPFETVGGLYWHLAYNLKWDKLLEMSNDFVNTEGSHGTMSYRLANSILKEHHEG